MLARARGTVAFTDRGFSLSGAQARALGGDVRLEGGSRGMPGVALPAGGETTIQLRAQGTATAEGGRTVGGAASRPAGTAIAHAKQRQTRSFFIKLGAIAGAGIAIGTVYALSRGTSSTPPNASTGTRQ